METAYNKCQKELEDYIKSLYPLIFLRTSEESRAIECIIDAHNIIIQDPKIKQGRLYKWSKTDGFLMYVNNEDEPEWQSPNQRSDQEIPKATTIEKALNELQLGLISNINEENYKYTYILPDWSAFIENNSLLAARQLKELAIFIESPEFKAKMALIIIGQDWAIPSILRNYVHILDLPIPTKEELYKEVFEFAIQQKNIKPEQAKSLSEQAQGITRQTAILAARLISTRELWNKPEEAKQLLLEVKKQEIRKTGVLEYYEPKERGIGEVGGLVTIRNWIKKRQSYFLEPTNPKLRPRAILLEGYPGCGKSLIARAIAQEWGVPQINFEIGRLQSKYVGESESLTAQALRSIEASAPNILFMDEIEKAFAGVGSDSTGVSTRQFGTFLSWLNDHNYPIFFIATSNDRSQLPPELFRAGRFDEIFIIMPPNNAERKEILQKKAIEYDLQRVIESNLDDLVKQTLGFSGAELEKLVKEAVYLSEQNLSTQSIWEKALKQVKPQFNTPKMKMLLKNYSDLMEQGGGINASSEDSEFLEELKAKLD